MLRLLVALLLLASFGAAQPQATPRKTPARKAAAVSSEPGSWPIETMHVKGNRLFTERDTLALSGLKIGQRVGKADFETARVRMLASGAFDTVGFNYAPAPDGKGYAVVFEVAEITQVYPYQFEDLEANAAELRSYLKKKIILFGEQIPATKMVLDEYIKAIEEYLAAKGHPEKVTSRVIMSSPEKLTIVFRPAITPPVVADVRFTGNQVIGSRTLRNALAGVAVGVVYREATLRELLDTSVRPLYEAHGHIRVAFSTLQTEKAKDVNGVVVIVGVNEGDRYNLGDIDIQGSSVTAGSLYKAANFKVGDVANFDEINAGLDRIYKEIRRKGYMQVRSTVERKINEPKKTVNLVIHIEPGTQYQFGSLTIEGLDLHGEAAMKKLWATKPGDPFNADYPEYFLSQVREAGYFENLGRTRPVVKVDEQTHTVDVTLIFQGEERPGRDGERPRHRAP
jgi:outer membrane protein assembly factor BamA